MGCNCKNSIKINDANSSGLNHIQKGLNLFKKVLLMIFAICLAIVVTPIVIVVIIYKMIFKGGEPVVIPNKILKMLK